VFFVVVVELEEGLSGSRSSKIAYPYLTTTSLISFKQVFAPVE
jgi:hypothetical protein